MLFLRVSGLAVAFRQAFLKGRLLREAPSEVCESLDAPVLVSPGAGGREAGSRVGVKGQGRGNSVLW